MSGINVDEIMETVQERLSEAFSSKAKMKLVKGKTGLRYAVVGIDAVEGLGEEYWYNLDPVGGDASVPRLRFALKLTDEGRFCTYKDEKFGALEHPKEKYSEWWRRLASKDVTWLNKQFRDWMALPAGKSFIDKNRLEDCLCVKNWLETANGKRA